ncbi:hypothetical protein QN277_012396 [Acacia crassicarpa]|uniref:Cytochrome P450 n=1 Tax=Acacia crassicarpa TaxID=499986 RepID=A0AAE1N141_9FABA|nr:hypothetical protein QN277_012396 [Acacia crassicarpa]
MFPLALAIPFVLFFTFIFLLSTSILFTKRQQDDLKRPPGPPSLPIIGNLHMLGELPHRSLQLLAQKYGAIMSLKLGQIPAVVVSSHEAAELFLKTHDTDFASRPDVQASDPLSRGTKGLAFAAYGPYWRYVRKVCTLHLLSASRVQMLAPLRRAELGSNVKSLEKVAAAREVVNLSEAVEDLIEETIYKMILGRGKDDRFNLKGLIKDQLSLVGQFNMADYVPWLGAFDFQGLTRNLRRNHKAIEDVLEKIVTEHEQAAREQNEQNHNKDFMHTMLSLIHQPMELQDQQNHFLIDRDHLKVILIDMIFAAADTSIVVIDFVFSELLRHPRVMKNLQKELQNVIGMNRMVEEADLAKLSYLDMVIKETLRLHPPAPLIPRENTEDVTVNGYYIKKKSRIIVNVWAIGRDPKVWSDDASMFYPERFVGSNIDIQGQDFHLIPFGSGRRRCPGIQMGMTTVKLVVAQLVHCFSWELPSGMRPSDLDMNEKFGLTVPRIEPILAVPTYRLGTDNP